MTRWQATTTRDSRHDRVRHATTPGRATVLILVGLLLGALLTAPALLETAERQPYGPTRTVLVETTELLVAASTATRLDVPWRTLDSLVHGPEATVPDATQRATSPPVVADPAPPVVDEQRPSPTPTARPSVEASVEPSPIDAPTPPPAVSAREPTPDDPLRVWIAGDSMWERPGPRLAALLEATGVVDVVNLEYRYSTGLTRPDFFDWPAHAASQVASLRPEVVLFLVGPNDSQPLVTDGMRHEPGSDRFRQAYTRRVREMMEVLAEGTDLVLWIGLPVMRDAWFDDRMATLDEVYAAQAAAVEGVEHVATRALFSDEGGGYAAYLPGPDGVPRRMRLDDGIHLSNHGAARLADHLSTLLDARYALTD